MPGQPLGECQKSIDAWTSLSMVDPALHSSLLFGAYSHKRTQWVTKRLGHFDSLDHRQLIIAEAESITRINSALQDPSKAISDATILSVLRLASNTSPPEPRPKVSPFQSPLRSLQWLDIYGSLSANTLHKNGLTRMIQLRGGLYKIRLPGLAAVIS